MKNYKKLKVAKNRLGPILCHHPWIFSGAISNITNDLNSGDLVKIYDDRDVFLCQGYFNKNSQIAVRVWSYDENEEVDEIFFEKRIEKAYLTRKEYLENKDTNSFRIINSENDFLPGLIVDKYDNYLVVQFHTLGIENFKKEIISALKKILNPEGIYEKSDSYSRRVENLEERAEILFGKIPDKIEIKENGLKFFVDIKNGQKTGFFLDQRDKRQAIIKYSNGKKILNCFSYTGGFSVYALFGGASKVVSVDASKEALEIAKENVKLNNLDINKCEFVCDDVKNYLRNIKKGDFDLIILDPPAFIKERRKKEAGVVGYKNINEAAINLLKENGVLVTCSCSAHFSEQDFRFMLSELCGKTKRNIQILEHYSHGIDHLELAPFFEGDYLKCFVLKV